MGLANPALSIAAPPANQSVVVGHTATFSVKVSGTGLIRFQWNRNGVAIAGATSSSYTTPATVVSNSGAQFTVTAQNSAGSVTSVAATLTVTTSPVAPSIAQQPASQAVPAGKTATFSVTASGTDPLTYQWNQNGVAIAGATSSSYTTPATVASNNGAQFTVTAQNSVGSATSVAATLSVTPSSVAPAIGQQPVSQTVTAGKTATFSVTASGTAPLTYQWNQNGVAIAGATSSSYTTPATVASNSGAQFTVTVTNSAGSVTSAAATLTVTASSVAPSIVQQPASQTVTVGQTATFSATASGTAPLTYQWNQNGVAIAGATSSSYTTPATVASNSGAQFTVAVTNSAGSVTSAAATLTVTASPVAPSIVRQPASQTVTAGQTATFSVTASGTAPLTYQWSQNGVAIAGATSPSYTTPATVASNSGAKFTVTVSNSVGNVTSNGATLTVNGPGQLSTSQPSLSFGNVNVGSSSTLSVTLSNTGASNVTISNVSLSGAGFNASGVSAGTILAPGQFVMLNASFTPAASGNATGSVTVTSNATNSPVNISLSGSGVQVAQNSVVLTWSPSPSSVAGYNIYRSTVSGGPYSILNSSLNVPTTFTDSNVQAGQTYYYVVTAVNSSNVESAYSNVVSATIP